ncbi:hypothetical protein PACTADRAFT_50967 [Pachysolen tannophilus NRRL Y-2460]|uniref:Mitochondrial import inner membrane translocase subunit TIM50 n=1 Tax=Pachysolen tannophilus NRRL Y-2460 TaxID=669874 RepID=A0A1E4TQX0_PACTA|nr:hypothetical protein PACTADRAFT_50967 [Pachysolen tannophilus NRRL Y-2460]
MSLLRGSLGSLKQFSVGGCGSRLSINRCLTGASSRRLYNTSMVLFNEEKKKKPGYQSILNDELLSKAGVDTNEPVKKDGSSTGSSANSSSSSAEEASKSELNEELKSKYEQQRRQQSKRKHVTSTDLKRERWANIFYIVSFGSILGGTLYLSRNWEEDEKEFYDESGNGYTPGLMFNRFKKRFDSVFSLFSEPAYEELLPPPPPEPYRRPLTLVLTLDDLLVHSEWSSSKGWKTAKRPGLDYFLGYLSQYYEIVIFSSNYMMYSEKTIQKLDPYHAFVSFALFKESCRYKDGKVIKDLSLMNRDLKKMVLVDVDPAAYSLQPENAIPMDPWDGKPDDKLIKLIPFLEYLATQPLSDVRPILNSFKDKKKIPEEFLERENLLRKNFEKEFKEQQVSNSSDWASKFLGLPTAQQRGSIPKMPLDIIREEGQKQYLQFQKYLKENGEKLLEEEKQKEKEFLSENKFTLEKLLVEGMPSPEEVAKQQAAKLATSDDQKGTTS